LKLEWMQTFIKVAEVKSFSEAAEQIPCSQSSVSRQIKSMEDELGVTLLKRSSNSNSVELTKNGEVALRYCERILADYSALLEDCRPDTRRKETLTVGLVARTFSMTSKGKLISRAFLENPEVELKLVDVEPDKMEDVLLSGEVDALVYVRSYEKDCEEPALSESGPFLYQPLAKQQVHVAIGERFVSPEKTSVRFSELANHNIIFNVDIAKRSDKFGGNDRHVHFVKACREAGFEPRFYLVEHNLPDNKATLVALGKGVFPSTIPASLRDSEGLRYLTIEDAPYYVQYYVVKLRKNKKKAINAFVEFMKTCFDS